MNALDGVQASFDRQHKPGSNAAESETPEKPADEHDHIPYYGD